MEPDKTVVTIIGYSRICRSQLVVVFVRHRVESIAKRVHGELLQQLVGAAQRAYEFINRRIDEYVNSKLMNERKNA